MKQLSFPVIVVLISFICLSSTCGKDVMEDPAPSFQLSSGFLITKGPRVDGTNDSLMIRLGPADMVHSWDEEFRPYVDPAETYWHLVQTGSGMNRWRIEINRRAYPGAPDKSYMKYEGTVYRTSNSNFTVAISPSDSTLFMIDWEADQFTIRPVMDPSLYLNTAQTSAPNRTHHTHLKFATTPQKFFLIR
jgi:hypothetical protein